MKIKVRYIFLTILSLSYLSTFSQSIPPDSLFLGQTPPGVNAKVFNLPVAPGCRAVERVTISSDGKEIYFSEQDTYPPNIQRIKCLKYLENKWQEPFLSGLL